jgi:hypothetical protein
MKTVPESCGATFVLDNGEYVTPCSLPDGHAGPHTGRRLGSRCTWTSNVKHSSEEDERRKCHMGKHAKDKKP